MAGSGTVANDTEVAMFMTAYAGGLQHRSARLVSNSYTTKDASAAVEPVWLALENRAGMGGGLYDADAADWPDPAGMTRPVRYFSIANNLPTTSDGSFAPTTDVLRLWAERGAGNAFTATFSRLRVLRQPWGGV